MRHSEILDQILLKEAAQGAVNFGEAMETIFAIIAANFLATGKSTLADVEKIRKKLVSGQEYVVFDSDLGDNHIKVSLLTRLKTEALKTVFGKSASPDMPDILKRRTVLLITSFEQTSAYSRIKSLRDEFIKEGEADIVSFMVEADGVSGESMGGTVKGDILVKIKATNKGGKTVVLPFSIKSNSTTVSNLSPSSGMLKFAKVFGLSEKLKKDLESFKDKYKSYDPDTKRSMIENLFSRMIKEVKALSFTPQLTKDVFDLLEKEVFGDDLADVIDITNTSIKEISLANFRELRKNTKIQVISTVRTGPPVLQFFREPESGELSLNDMIFQLRTKIRETSSGALEAKFYVETGKLLYLTKKAELETKLDNAQDKDDTKKAKKIEKELDKTPVEVYKTKEKETKQKQSKTIERNARRFKTTAKVGDRKKKK